MRADRCAACGAASGDGPTGDDRIGRADGGTVAPMTSPSRRSGALALAASLAFGVWFAATGDDGGRTANVAATTATDDGATDGERSAPVERATIPDDPVAPVVAADGAFDEVRVEGTLVSLAGWALDHDGPDAATAVAITIDGRRVAEAPLTVERFDVQAVAGGAAPLGFEVVVDLADSPHGVTADEPGSGAHRVCARTVPDDDLVTCTRVAPQDHLGVLVSPSGVMVEILADLRGPRWRVRTPCGNVTVVEGGTHLRTVQILLDPGHGGAEISTVGANGLSEGPLNLDVAFRTAALLRERGFSVAMTREVDMTLPIEIRANLANALDPDLFLSIHHNGGAIARKSVPGTQTLWQHDDPESRRAAGILYEHLFAAASAFPTTWVGTGLDGAGSRLNAEGGDFYGIHRRTPDVTSVITEFLWLSNPAEARLLARDDVRDAQAVALADGVERWYRGLDDGSGYVRPWVDTFDAGGGGFEGCVDPDLEARPR